jgi:Type II secretion system (T2SS), protein E, N-terminal domain
LPKSLAQIAVDAGLLSRADVARAQEVANERSLPLVVVVVREFGVDEIALVAAFRRELRILMIDPKAVTPDLEAFRQVPRELCRKHRVAPLEIRGGPGRDDKELWLAMADPTDTAAIAAIEQATGALVDVALLPLSAIDELIEQGDKQSTKVVRRAGKPFGGRAVVVTRPHARALTDDSVESTATMRLKITEQADTATKLAALVKLLVAKGVIGQDEYDDAIRELIRDASE